VRVRVCLKRGGERHGDGTARVAFLRLLSTD